MAGSFRASNGKVAVWTGGNDLAPFNNPLANIGRVKFHSDFDYVRVIRQFTRTVNIPAIPASGSGQSDPGSKVAVYNLGVHGEGRTPFIVGLITVAGVTQAFTGSVLVHHVNAPNATSINDSFGRWLSLGVDATNIWVHEYSIQDGDKSAALWTSRPAQSFPITICITDVSL